MNLVDLGRRAVACRHWKWLNGCLWEWNEPAREPKRMRGRVGVHTQIPQGAYPVLTDPATRGCMWQVLRDAWGNDWVTSYFATTHDHWEVELRPHGWVTTGPTEEEALVKALEYAHRSSKVGKQDALEEP